MADNRENYRIGSVKVIVDGVELGYTSEDTEIVFTEEVADITVDGFGNTLIDQTVLGRGIEITGSFKQVSKNDLQTVWANVLRLNDTADANKLIYDHATNESHYQSASEVILRRRVKGADTTEDFFIYKASLKVNGGMPLNNSDMAVLPFMITAYADAQGRLGGFGDSDA